MAASEPFPKAEECHPGRAFKRNFGRHGIVSAEHESRIVRVSRLTGGKDRHSKVLTYKGARDRRVRLSVSTAIQFYDLQDRLNLEQPSQVIDWLINEAKSAIEKLPALPSEAPSVTQITSSNGSPMKAARSAAITTAARTGIGAGPPVQDEQSKMQGIESPGKSLDRHVSHGSVQEPDMGRSTGSTSDGSVKAHFKFASKLATRGKSRHKEARQKAKERTQKKPYAVTKSPRLLNELLSLPSSESEQLNAGSHISILRAVSTSDGVPSTLQQLWNERGVSYSTTPYSQDSTQQNTLQQVFSSVVSSSPGILRSHLPSLCTFGSCSPQCHDVPDLSGLLLDEKDKFSAGSSFSAPQIQTSLPFSALVRNMEHPMAQHLPHVQRHISSAITPNMEFSDSMWNPSCRGPLQSNAAVELTTSSGMTNKTSVQDYDSRFSQGFHF